MKKWKVFPLCLAAVMTMGVCLAGCGDDEGDGENNGDGDQTETLTGNQGTVNADLLKQLAVKVPDKTANGITIDLDVTVGEGESAVAYTGDAKADLQAGKTEMAVEASMGENKMYIYSFSNAAGMFSYKSTSAVTAWNNSIELDYLSLEDEIPAQMAMLNPMAFTTNMTTYNSVNYEILALSTQTALVKQEDTGYTVTVKLDETAKTVIGDISAIANNLTSTSTLNSVINDAVLSSYIENCFGLVKAKTIYTLVNGFMSSMGGSPTALEESGGMNMAAMMQMFAAIWTQIPEPEDADGILDWLKDIADLDANVLAPSATGKLGDLTLGDMGLPSSLDLGTMWKGIADGVLEQIDCVEKAEVVMTFDTEKNFVGETVEFSIKNLVLGGESISGDSNNSLSALADEEETKALNASGTLTFTYSATAPQTTDISACKVATPTSLTFTEGFVAFSSRIDDSSDPIVWTEYKLVATLNGENVDITISSKDISESSDAWQQMGTFSHSKTFAFMDEFVIGGETFWFEYGDIDWIDLFMELDSNNSFQSNVYDENYDESEPQDEIDISDIVSLGYSTVGELLAALED